MLAGIVRPPRKTKCKLRTTQRRPHTLTKVLTVIWVLGTIAIASAWFVLPEANQDSLFSSIVGLGVGGGLVWAIRIVGSYAMNQEAMGFGDVVLMSMIGAFLGWQPSLMVVFALAPCSAIFIALAYFVLTQKNELAFGPYLCFGTLVLILFWNDIWPVGAGGLFAVGGKFLVVVGAAGFLLMAAMLLGIRWLKSLFLPAEDESHQA
jgi:prepilin signal peptidase PulO-like enzyme (type II secretory pathway)